MTITDGPRLGGVMSEGVELVGEILDEADRGDLRSQLALSETENEILRENLTDLRLALEDRGWETLGAFDGAEDELPHVSLVRASTITRTLAIANPLIRRGLALRSAYVWGQGVQVSAQATGPTPDATDAQDVNAVVQTWLDDPDVRKVLTSASARQRNERALGTDGNLYVALFTAPQVGTVQPRIVAFRSIVDVVSNPDDATETWFYVRRVTDAGGQTTTEYHPDVDFRPRTKVARITGDTNRISIDGLELGTGHGLADGVVRWDAPILHVKVNDLPEWKFGIGDAFSSIAWARGYKVFLEDWAKLVKALARFAFRATAPTKSGAQAAAARIRQRPATDARDPRTAALLGDTPVGQTYVSTEGQSLEAIPKTGATIDSESGRPLAAMVAAGLEVPVTMLLADPGTTGNRATAETLDTPTELMASGRRDLWGDVLRRLLDYVIDQSVKAPRGVLRGEVNRDEWGRELITLDGNTSRTIVVEWPDLTDTPVNVLMAALAQADATDKLPPLLLVRLMLAAFKVRDPDEWLAEVSDPDTGEFVPPGTDPVRTDDPKLPEPPAPPTPDPTA